LKDKSAGLVFIATGIVFFVLYASGIGLWWLRWIPVALCVLIVFKSFAMILILGFIAVAVGLLAYILDLVFGTGINDLPAGAFVGAVLAAGGSGLILRTKSAFILRCVGIGLIALAIILSINNTMTESLTPFAMIVGFSWAIVSTATFRGSGRRRPRRFIVTEIVDD